MSHDLLRPHHLRRKAVIYIRQSTGHQVLSNLESQKLQLAMKEHALRLGWPESAIEIVETDTGISGQSATHRLGYKNLLSELALGEVGIVLSYESTRLSRNCSNWYPLLDLCALHNCLIGDRDGVYDPSCANGRLLLGMKGIVSEIELHTLRGRLLAGVQNKAERGELALALPAGLLRLENGSVVKDPDLQVQETISLVFQTFLEVRSAAKVVRRFRNHGLLVPRRFRNEQTLFRQPTLASVTCILKNPCYAGAFVYGRSRTVRSLDPQRSRPHQQRRPKDQWRIVVKDRYPAYISWEVFEQIQQMLADNYAAYGRNQSRGVPRDGAALLQGICYCGECGHKMVVQYKAGNRYLCNFHRQQTQAPVCQYLPADPIDRYVIEAFFQALSPVELDLYEQAHQKHCADNDQIIAAQDRQLQRLRYEVELARRQYDRVDPDNRLVASELERRWEAAMLALSQTEEGYARDRKKMQAQSQEQIPAELRAAFTSLGKSLPTLWASDSIPRETRKALLRCLIDKVVVHRLQPRELVKVRIVWRGGAFTETDLRVPVHALRNVSGHEQLHSRVKELHAQDRCDKDIAQIMTTEGFRSVHTDRLLPSTVRSVRLAQGLIQRYTRPRPRQVPGFLTVPQVSRELGVKPDWLYYLINRGVIDVELDPKTKLYLFPDRPELLSQLRQLRDGFAHHVSCGQE